jgi:hypothetical protein
MKTKTLLLTAMATFGMTIATMAQNVPNYVPTNGLVGWWPFNGNANDESGNGNNGTVNGATLTNDRFSSVNSAYQFDGISSYIQTTASGFLGQHARTFSFWINTSSASHQAPIDFYGGSGGAFSIVMNNPCPGIGVDCASGVVMKGDQILLNGNWHHCVLVYDSTLVNTISDLIVYVDGQIQSQVTCSALDPNCTINNTNSTDIVFGKTVSDVRYVDGKLDDIAIWNRALTQQEITELYNGNVCYQTITVTDTLLINMGIVSYNPVTYNNTIKIFPNPTNDHISINYGNFASMNGYQLKIENSLGQQIFQTNITQQSDYLSLTNWGGNGLYFVRVIDPQGNTIDIRKIVLQ